MPTIWDFHIFFKAKFDFFDSSKKAGMRIKVKYLSASVGVRYKANGIQELHFSYYHSEKCFELTELIVNPSYVCIYYTTYMYIYFVTDKCTIRYVHKLHLITSSFWTLARRHTTACFFLRQILFTCWILLCVRLR